MKKTERKRLREGSLDRYDWSKAVRGKHSAKAAKASAFLRMLDPQLARRFPDSRSVNQALHLVLELESALPRRRRGRSAA